jgi:Uma2 family endonuclease
MGMVAPLYYTADMVRALPDDGNRYEVVHGELLVTPAPRLWHQKVVGRLYTGLALYLQREPVGEVLHAPADISWGRDVLVQPDVFVVPREEARSLVWADIRTLLLAAEVLSPSSLRADRFTKRHLYQERSVQTYWVVDGDERVVEVWTPQTELPAIERERLSWHPAGAGRPCTLELAELFRPI